MSRPRLVIVDAQDARRDVFSAYLSTRFRVSAFPMASKAISAFDGLHADAVIAHVKQPGTSGVHLCKALRERPEGAKALIVLYGTPPRRLSAAQVEHVRNEAGADVFLPREVDEVDLEQVLGLKLFPPAEGGPVPLPTDAEVHFVSAHREAPAEDEGDWDTVLGADATRAGLLESLRRHHGQIIDKLPSDKDVTWGELLRARANLHNLGVLLDKPVTPLIRQLPEGRPLRLDEILRAWATLTNLKIILKQGVLPSEAPAETPPEPPSEEG